MKDLAGEEKWTGGKNQGFIFSDRLPMIVDTAHRIGRDLSLLPSPALLLPYLYFTFSYSDHHSLFCSFLILSSRVFSCPLPLRPCSYRPPPVLFFTLSSYLPVNPPPYLPFCPYIHTRRPAPVLAPALPPLSPGSFVISASPIFLLYPPSTLA